MELVESDCLLDEFESAARVAAFQACVAGALKESDQGHSQAVDVPVGPGVIGAFERFAAPESERGFERLRLGLSVMVATGEQRVELVEVDSYLAAVQASLAVPISAVTDGAASHVRIINLAEQSPHLFGSL